MALGKETKNQTQETKKKKQEFCCCVFNSKVYLFSPIIHIYIYIYIYSMKHQTYLFFTYRAPLSSWFFLVSKISMLIECYQWFYVIYIYIYIYIYVCMCVCVCVCVCVCACVRVCVRGGDAASPRCSILD